MLSPFRVKTNEIGNIIFESEHIPTGKKELIDRVFKCWMLEHEFDPITKEIISKCTCPDFNINRMKNSPCKHILSDLVLLEEFK